MGRGVALRAAAAVVGLCVKSGSGGSLRGAAVAVSMSEAISTPITVRTRRARPINWRTVSREKTAGLAATRRRSVDLRPGLRLIRCCRTRAQELFGLTKPIFLAGMNVAAGPELAAAVSNEGGLGVIGGVGATVDYLRDQCKKIKEGLVDKSAPWGIDLLLPQVGGSARKTNKDYTNGELPELIDVIIEEGASLFVSAVGVPPKFAVDKLHAVRSMAAASPAPPHTCAYGFTHALDSRRPVFR